MLVKILAMNLKPICLIMFCSAVGALINGGQGALIGFLIGTTIVTAITLFL